MAKEWNLPYKTEPWENPLYWSYIDQARSFSASGHGAARDRMLTKASNLKRQLIADYTQEQQEEEEYQRKLTEETDKAIIDAIGDGFIPTDLQDNFIDRLNVGRALEAAKAALPFSPVVLIVVAGVIFLIYKK